MPQTSPQLRTGSSKALANSPSVGRQDRIPLVVKSGADGNVAKTALPTLVGATDQEDPCRLFCRDRRVSCGDEKYVPGGARAPLGQLRLWSALTGQAFLVSACIFNCPSCTEVTWVENKVSVTHWHLANP